MNGAMELLRAAQEGDRDACEQAVLENNGLIWSVVRRYYGRGVEPDDLYQLGCLGFLKAIRGFDFSYGTCFSTYAVPKIAGEIRRFLRDDGTIKVGRSIREQALTLYALRERLRQELGREPSLSELSAQTGWSPEEIAQVDLATEAPDSLQRETADGLALEGLLGTEAPEEGLVERIALREAVDGLSRESPRLAALRDRLIDGLTGLPYTRLTGDPVNRLPGTASFVFEGVEGEALLLHLDARGICASSGSACSSASLDPSHVLLAIGLPHAIAHGSLRLSLGAENTEADVDYILKEVPQVVAYLRELSPVWDRDAQKPTWEL